MLNLLQKIALSVASSRNLHEILTMVVETVVDNIGADVCSIFLWNEKLRRYQMAANRGFDPAQANQVTLGANEGIISVVGKKEEPVNLADAGVHPAFHLVTDLQEEELHGLLAVPIIHQRKLLGVLVVQKHEKSLFDQSHEAFLVTVSAQMAFAIAHAEASGQLGADFFGHDETDVRFDGVAGSSGVAIGHAVVLSHDVNLNMVPSRVADDIEHELASFEEALERVRADMRQAGAQLSADVRPEERALFDVYLGILNDDAIGAEVRNLIQQGEWAQGAVAQVIRQYSGHFSEMEDAYLRERGSDIRDLGRRILTYLQQKEPVKKEIPDNAIIVGEELTPALLAEVPEGKLAAIVSVMGSSNSHIAILARAMGIPTVMGLVDMPFQNLEGQELVVDGYRGHVYYNLSPDRKTHFEEIIREEQEMVQGLESVKGLPCETRDGQCVKLMVNTGLMTDVVRSLDRGAEGVGLYRTEVPFMMHERFPSEFEQSQIYRQQLEAFAPRQVVMRTLDIGGDKSLDYFPIVEDNPFLGWRGIRVTLDHPEIFLVQVRAMLRASEGLDNLGIMLPMVSNVSELEEAQRLIHRAVYELEEEGVNISAPAVGMMVEVPANLYQIKEFATRVDFLSVGSNDLTQYLLAVDRANPRVADLYNNFHPAVLQALKKIIDDASPFNTPVSICGEIAGDPMGAVLLVAMGYQSLSMNSSSLLKVKAVLREVDLVWAKDLLERILSLDSPLVIKSTLEFSLKKAGIPLSRLGITKSYSQSEA